MANGVLHLLDKGLSCRRKERKVVVRKANRIPFACIRKALLDLIAKNRIRINTDPLATQVSHGSFRRTATANCLDVAMVSGQVNKEASIQKQIE